MHVTQDDVLLPYLRMGVEAREQVLGQHGREDARITRPNHPLVKYAEAFTHNFDLIAERKSVVFHLRELAKASVLAKFLVETRVDLEEAWLDLAGEPEAVCCQEVPQLWNDRYYSKIDVKEGAIVNAEQGIDSRGWGLYGGVQFGLDKFRLGGVAGSIAAVSAARLGGPRVAGFAPARLSAMGFAPKGVDLSLNKFSLASARVVDRTGRWGSVSCPGACAAVGGSFWASLGAGSEQEPAFKPEDRSLFNTVFNLHLSDRRDEGERFTPPDTSLTYVNRLRALVREEEAVRQQRREHFLSSGFAPGSAGELFPSSWTDSFKVAHGQGQGGQAAGLAAHRAAARSGLLEARPEYRAEAQLLEQALRSAVPSFDRSTEDGARFRIYRIGRLEVRTTQAHDGEEAVGAVFSVRAAARAPAESRWGWIPQPQEALARAVLYVERAGGEGRLRETVAASGRPHCHHYVALHFERGAVVVTEKFTDGTVAWSVNPSDLEERSALAKVLRTEDCSGAGVTLEDMQRHQAQSQSELGASRSQRKRYARRAFDAARGRR